MKDNTFKCQSMVKQILIVASGFVVGLFCIKIVSAILNRKPSRFREMVRKIKLLRSGRTMNQTLDTI